MHFGLSEDQAAIRDSPLEIEQIVARHEAVSEVAVVGIPDPVFGERTCACVVLRPGVAGLALDELTGYMRAQQNAAYKLPERLEIFAELPRTAGGKLKGHAALRGRRADGGAAGTERRGRDGAGGPFHVKCGPG